MKSDIFTKAAVPINGVVRKLAIAAAGSIDIPKGASLVAVHVRNNTANAITGGLKIGSTAGGTDFIAAGAVAASALASFYPLVGLPNAAAVRTVYLDAVTAWNSASVDVAVEYTVLV